MAIRTYDILLDSYNSTIPEPIVGRQGDKNGAVTLHVTITDRGTAVDLTGQTINLMAETAKGTAIVADNLGVTLTDAINGKFDYAIPNALWSEAGKIKKAYFSLNAADGQQTTYDLIFMVKAAVDVTQEKADDYVTVIDGTIRDLKTKADAIYKDFSAGNFYNKNQTDTLIDGLKESISDSETSAKSYVEFQTRRIHSADNAIDININDKYMSVADSYNRVFISGGEIQMIQPTLFSKQATPYARISNSGGSASVGGATFWGRDYFVVTNGANDKNIFSSSLGEETFAGISGGNSTAGWQVTKIGGAERGVLISGGKAFDDGVEHLSPSITVGDSWNSGSGMRGSNITMHGNYIYLRSPHTTSKGANAYLGTDGALVPSTSAAKYKTDIVRTFETEMGNKLLEVPVAHWKDKEEVLAKTRDSNAKDPETYFGMIADDLDDAGLNELVEYDDKGEVRGIQYDRVALSILPLIRNYRDRISELETKVKQMKEA